MAQKYFNGLNYSMANEDTALERGIVKKIGPKKILSVCGSGSRALSLLTPEVQELHCADLSERQLSLARLRLLTNKRLDHDDFLKFWGHAPYSIEDHKAFRKDFVENCKASLEDHNIWRKLHEKNEWASLLYKGKWESSFSSFGKIVNTTLGRKALELFQFSDIDAQKEFLDKKFPWKRWNLLVKVIGNRATFNALLYKGDFIKKNVKKSYFEYYSEAFERLFTTAPAKENFFLQLCLLGAVRFPEGNIIEAKKDVYEDVKESSALIDFHQGDVLATAKESGPFDFISISDVPSYFSGETEKGFLNSLLPCLNSGGHIVIRSYLRVPKADRDGYDDVSSQFTELIQQEKTQMYIVEVLRKK